MATRRVAVEQEPMAPPTLDELVRVTGVPPQRLDEPCSDEHLRDISSDLTHWRNVAPFLGLKEGDIEEIERDIRTESEKRPKALQKWKNKFGFKATYRVLTEAFLMSHMAEHAEKVCHLLSQQSSNDDSAQNLYDEIHVLEREYDDLVDQVEDSLTKAETDLSLIKNRIVRLPVSLKHSHWEVLEPEAMAAIESTTSIRGLFTLLHNQHWDCMNCELLCHIIDKFGDPKNKESTNKYLNHLRRFRTKTKLKQMVGLPWMSARCDRLEKCLVLQMGEKWRDQTLEELEHFLIKFSYQCTIKKSTVSVCEIMEGRIAVTLALPTSVDIAALQLQDLREFLKQHQVLRIMSNGSCILDTTIPKVGVEQSAPRKEEEQSQLAKKTAATVVNVSANMAILSTDGGHALPSQSGATPLPPPQASTEGSPHHGNQLPHPSPQQYITNQHLQRPLGSFNQSSQSGTTLLLLPQASAEGSLGSSPHHGNQLPPTHQQHITNQLLQRPLDQRPSLGELLKFQGRTGHINIPREIGRKYTKLSAFLLNDKTGSIAKSIARECMGDAEDINMEIMSRWLRGEGRQPVTWRTLVGALRDASLTSLASDIECASKY